MIDALTDSKNLARVWLLRRSVLRAARHLQTRPALKPATGAGNGAPEAAGGGCRHGVKEQRRGPAVAVRGQSRARIIWGLLENAH